VTTIKPKGHDILEISKTVQDIAIATMIHWYEVGLYVGVCPSVIKLIVIVIRDLGLSNCAIFNDPSSRFQGHAIIRRRISQQRYKVDTCLLLKGTLRCRL